MHACLNIGVLKQKLSSRLHLFWLLLNLGLGVLEERWQSVKLLVQLRGSLLLDHRSHRSFLLPFDDLSLLVAQFVALFLERVS
jgi:hypothetical protein